MTREVSQTETGEVFLASFDLLEGTSESARAKTAETFLELLGARVRNPLPSDFSAALSAAFIFS